MEVDALHSLAASEELSLEAGVWLATIKESGGPAKPFGNVGGVDMCSYAGTLAQQCLGAQSQEKEHKIE